MANVIKSAGDTVAGSSTSATQVPGKSKVGASQARDHSFAIPPCELASSWWVGVTLAAELLPRLRASYLADECSDAIWHQLTLELRSALDTAFCARVQDRSLHPASVNAADSFCRVICDLVWVGLEHTHLPGLLGLHERRAIEAMQVTQDWERRRNAQRLENLARARQAKAAKRKAAADRAAAEAGAAIEVDLTNTSTRARLMGLLAFPCGSWRHFCPGDRLFYGAYLKGANLTWQERNA